MNKFLIKKARFCMFFGIFCEINYVGINLGGILGNIAYQRKPGGGRPPMSPRKVLEAIFFVLRTGIQWKALPKSFGSSSSIHRYFKFWAEAGFFKALWASGLKKYDEVVGINWEWLSGDGCMTKAPLAQETVGDNPTDRGKKR